MNIFHKKTKDRITMAGSDTVSSIADFIETIIGQSSQPQFSPGQDSAQYQLAISTPIGPGSPNGRLRWASFG